MSDATGRDDATAPQPSSDSTTWQRVSRKYVLVELVPAVVMCVVLAAAVVVLIVLDLGWIAAIVGFVLLWALVGAILTVPTVRSIGYRLRDDDLVFRRGLVWRREIAVPYGRMQLIDIRQGPIERSLGLASLKLVTAAPSGSVTVTGYTRAQIESLRAHLVELAESRRAGL